GMEGGLSAAVSEGAAAVSWLGGDLLAFEAVASVRIYDSRPPVIGIRSPNRVLVGEEVVFRASIRDAHKVTTSWSFGDGGSAHGELVSHTFAKPGKYTVGLHAVDSAGNEARINRQITVYADP